MKNVQLSATVTPATNGFIVECYPMQNEHGELNDFFNNTLMPIIEKMENLEDGEAWKKSSVGFCDDVEAALKSQAKGTDYIGTHVFTEKTQVFNFLSNVFAHNTNII